MSEHLDDGTYYMNDRCKKCIHVTELSITRYDIPLTVTWSELAGIATRGKPDDEGFFDVAISFEGYEAAECCAAESDFDTAIDDALGWFQDRGSACFWKDGLPEE